MKAVSSSNRQVTDSCPLPNYFPCILPTGHCRYTMLVASDCLSALSPPSTMQDPRPLSCRLPIWSSPRNADAHLWFAFQYCQIHPTSVLLLSRHPPSRRYCPSAYRWFAPCFHPLCYIPLSQTCHRQYWHCGSQLPPCHHSRLPTHHHAWLWCQCPCASAVCFCP